MLHKAISHAVVTKQYAAFIQVIEQLGLIAFYHYVTENNPSADAPYHSDPHQFHVARGAYELYCLDNVIAGTYDVNQARNLVAAALIHDFWHSQGKENDAFNIERVIWSIDAWRATYGDLVDWDVVTGLVKATQFPYVEGDYPYTYTHLRDADFMYGFEPHALTAILEGIPEEAAHRIGRKLKPTEFLVEQRKFLDGVKPTSISGRRIWDHAVEHSYAMQKAFAEYLEAAVGVNPFNHVEVANRED